VTATAAPPGGALQRVRTLAHTLGGRDGWSPERMRGHQREALRATLARAVAASPYYREALGPDAPNRPLHELPTLPKETLVAEWDRIVTDPVLRLADVEAHAAGPDAIAPFGGRYRVFCTSGSSGLRGLFVFAPDEWETWVALHLRMFMRIGLRPDMRLAPIGAPGASHLTRQLFAVFRAGRAGAPRLSVLTPVPEIVEALNAYRPDALLGYPSVAGVLADEQLAGRLRIAPRLAMFGAEPTTADLRRRMEAAWGLRPGNIYGTTEIPTVASSTPEHPDALEVIDDAVVVEVVDERNRPVPPGVPGAKVLVTALLNRAQPLIRYELSDRVTRAAGPNPAGRPWTLLERIDGRTADTLRLPARGGGEVAVMPYRLGEPLARTAGLRQFQVVWDGARMEVRLVLGPTAARHAAAQVRRDVADALAAAGAVPPAIAVRTVGALEREPGPAAKLKLIKAQLPSARP
jgi:phenylacetate-coenzyme A ligase PaaK-like adenylate-forming protein